MGKKVKWNVRSTKYFNPKTPNVSTSVCQKPQNVIRNYTQHQILSQICQTELQANVQPVRGIGISSFCFSVTFSRTFSPSISKRERELLEETKIFMNFIFFGGLAIIRHGGWTAWQVGSGDCFYFRVDLRVAMVFTGSVQRYWKRIDVILDSSR